MDKELIYKYIDLGQEREFLDKLRVYQIDDYNSQLKNLIKILLVLLEKGNDHFDAQQYFYKIIANILPQIMSGKDSQKEFVDLVKSNAIPPYVYASQIFRQMIIAVVDREVKADKYAEEAITAEKIEEFKKLLTKINVYFLDKSIKENYPYDNIISIFYCCVNTLEAQRRVIIDKEAIALLRAYLTENPIGYLEGFIRPLYSGGINSVWPEYFLHVPEPFYGQIFDDQDFPFLDFLQVARDKLVDGEMVNDVEAFYREVIEKDSVDGNKSLLLSNKLTDHGLVLMSKKHLNIRPENKE